RVSAFAVNRNELAKSTRTLASAIPANVNRFDFPLTEEANLLPRTFASNASEFHTRVSLVHARATIGEGAYIASAGFLARTIRSDAGSSCPRSRVVGTGIRNCAPLRRKNLPTSSTRSRERE